MIGDDPPCASQTLERAKSQRIRAARTLDVPQSLHHRLQVRSLDAACMAVRVRDPFPANAVLDPFSLDLTDHRSDKAGVDRDDLARELREPLDRANDRGACAVMIEPLEP